MFSRVSKASQSLLPSAIRAGITRFYSTNYVSSEIIDNISHFDQDKTRQALIHVQKNLKEKVDQKNLLILDQISEAPSSITNRAFNPKTKQFFAVQTLKLDSNREWNQVNLALRQYSFVKPALSRVLGMDYNEERQEVKIFSELGKSILDDYCSYRVGSSMGKKKPWTNSELRFLYWNIVNQLNTLRAFGGVCEAIKPRNLLYDTNANILKLYDLSDFDAIKGAQGFSLDEKIPINLDSAVYSLVQVINPYAPVHNSEEARAYLNTNHLGFLINELGTLQRQVEKWQSQPVEVVRSQIEAQLKKPPTEWFKEYEYEKFFLNRMEGAYKNADFSQDTKEWATLEWASLTQGIGNYIEAINTLRECLSRTLESHGENHENTSKIYAQLGDVYRAAENFEKASQCFEKAINIAKSSSEMDKLILAEIYNSYGKFLLDKKEYSQAIQLFDLADVNLVSSPEENTFLAEEIKTNKQFAYDMQEKNETNKKAKTGTSSSSSNSNDETEEESWKSWFSIWNIIKIVIFVKVACIAIREIQSDVRGVFPRYLPKEQATTTTESSQTNSMTTNQLPEEPASKPFIEITFIPPKSEDKKLEDKQEGANANEDVSITGGAQESKKGSSLLFGAILVISALGLTL